MTAIYAAASAACLGDSAVRVSATDFDGAALGTVYSLPGAALEPTST